MYELKECFADFQFLDHRIMKSSFVFPEDGNTESEIEFFVDYEVVKEEDSKGENPYFGVVNFEIEMRVDCKRCFSMTIEGCFTGNNNEYDYNRFKQMLRLNGTSMLSQISRSYILNVTSNVGFDSPVVIPMINIVELVTRKEEK